MQMDLSMEVLEEMDVPMSDQEGIGLVLIAAGTGIIVGAILT
jgi:hypothetical protein